jgi:toxin ParE1/3/4
VTLRWSKRALDDLETIGEHIAADRPRVAVEWVARLFRRAEDAAEHPLAGRVVPERGDPSLREVIERRYRIVYRVFDDHVLIVTIFEGHKRFRGE